MRVASWLNRRQAYHLAGWAAGLLSKSESAKTTATNLRVCFPYFDEAQRNALTRQSLQHMVLLFFELAQLRFWSREALLADVRIEGQQVLEAALARGKGVLLLVPHLGNWELMCVYLGHYYSVSALYDPPKQDGLEQEIKQARERFSGQMFAIGVGGMRSVLKELKRGGLIAILPDQVPERDGGVYADFFGQPALTMTLPHQLKAKTDAALVLGSVRREVEADGSYGYTLKFTEPVVAVDSTPEQTARTINQAIEEEVRLAPAQYQWEYKRFKRPPEGGGSNIYRRQ